MKIKLPNCDFIKEAKKERIKYSDEYLKIIEEADKCIDEAYEYYKESTIKAKNYKCLGKKLIRKVK